jgi:hypothetical protein
MRAKRRLLVRVVGLLIAVVLLVGLFRTAWGAIQKINWLNGEVLLGVAAATTCWIFGQVIAGWIWWFILGKVIARRLAVAILMVTQIGKYAPGNFGQFLGRAYLASRYGVPLSRNVTALAVESALVVGAALGLTGVMVLIDPPEVPLLARYLPNAGMVAGLLILAALVVLVVVFAPQLLTRILPPEHRWRRHVPGPIGIQLLIPAAALQVGNIAIAGLGLWLIALALSRTLLPLPIVIAVFATAAVAGFVTPGAPGGLGIREAVISAGLSSYLGVDLAIAVALTLRAATVLGDLVIFVLGWISLPARADVTAPQSSRPTSNV